MDTWTQYEKYRNDLTYTSEDGMDVMVCVGLSGTFYFWGGETQPVREAIVRCFERFQELFGPRLKWVMPMEDAESENREVVPDNNIASLRSYIATMDPDDLLSWRISGGSSWEEASDCYLVVLTAREWQVRTRNRLTWLNFAMPVEAVYGPQGNPRLFTDFIRFCCEQLNPWNGIAGLASLLPLTKGEAQTGEFDLLQRYFGLDAAASGFALTDDLQRHLKGTNWLTMFDDAFPSTVTQEQWKTLEATPGIRIWKAGRTWIVQAGDQPTLGPVPDGIPPLYKAVSDTLRPMRVTPLRAFHTGSMTGEIRFNERTAELWSQRFDAPGIWPPYPDQLGFHKVDETIDEYAAQPAVEPVQQPAVEPPRVTVLRATPGEACPADGEWFSPIVKNKVQMRKGEPMPGPKFNNLGEVIWYLRRG
ncbi:type VI immunity family protein [Paraburkholderia adhaesiva]|uniref:type VI immunity family protein n=1 Tax=Paraburkholderia adhaesiva TaxID=2883244 RepID=UPI001F29C068|nr:type VI immunity family protein [Paraburkholderia adhaesiva]